MIIEAGYRSKRENALKDEQGEYEWVEIPTFDGTKKVKKYKDPSVI